MLFEHDHYHSLSNNPLLLLLPRLLVIPLRSLFSQQLRPMESLYHDFGPYFSVPSCVYSHMLKLSWGSPKHCLLGKYCVERNQVCTERYVCMCMSTWDVFNSCSPLLMINAHVLNWAVSNMSTGSFQQLAFDVQPQFEDQQDHSPPRGTRCRFRQEDRLEPFGEVCELHTIACHGLCKTTFHFQTVSHHSRSDQCSYSRD